MFTLGLNGSIHTKSLLPWQVRSGIDDVEDNDGDLQQNESGLRPIRYAERAYKNGNGIKSIERPFMVEEISLRCTIEVDGSKLCSRCKDRAIDNVSTRTNRAVN